METLFYEFDDSDLNVIKGQLKNEDLYVGGVFERCTYGYPSIILLDPMVHLNGEARGNGDVNIKALSTLMWLTCPYLNDVIHNLESEGMIEKISDFIKSDRALEQEMSYSHASYYYLRKNVYRHFFDVDDSEKNIEFEARIFNKGIGSIEDTSYIK